MASVVDRLALALHERVAVLPGIGQRRESRRANAEEKAPQGPFSEQAAESRAALSPAGPSSEADVKAAFADALRDAGLRATGVVEMDGQTRRVAVEGDRKGQKSGAYIGHLDGWPVGFIRNQKTGVEIHWKANQPTWQMTPSGRSALAAEAAARSTERARKRQEMQARAARLAQRLWAAAEPAADHPYLAAKGVRSHGLRQDRHGRLLMPVHGIDGALCGVQRVGVDGSKLFLKGARTKGGHMLIGDSLELGTPLLVATSYVTGATLHEATGLSVAVAFNASNLAAVANAYRAADPARPIVIAGDNDHRLPLRPLTLPNVGREKAEAAAIAVKGVAVLPSFAPGDRSSDWNDLARREGHLAVAAVVREAVGRWHTSAADAHLASMARQQRVQKVPARRFRD